MVITGAGHGIGRAVAAVFGQAGARLVLLDVDREALELVQDELTRSGAHVERTWALDVGDRDAYREFADQCEAVDLLVNNAGVVHVGAFVDCSLEDWDWLYRANLLGVLHGCHYLLPKMIERRTGHVVNVASAAGLVPLAGIAAYSATKHAVVALSEALAVEAEPHGVSVSVICPSIVATGVGERMRFGNRTDSASARQRAARRTAGSGLAPEHVARAVLNAVEHRRRLVIVGREAHLLHATNRLSRRLTRGLVAWAEKRLR